MSGSPPKYDPLRRELAAQTGDRVTLTFAEIEALLGAPLPPGARARGFWANVTNGSPQARAWLSAGWRVVWCDPWGGRVTFVRQEVDS